MVGGMLKVWESGYAPGRSEADVPLGQREFSVTVPGGLEERCATAGDCVSYFIVWERVMVEENMLIDCDDRSCSGGGMGLRRSRRMNRVWILELWGMGLLCVGSRHEERRWMWRGTGCGGAVKSDIAAVGK